MEEEALLDEVWLNPEKYGVHCLQDLWESLSAN